MSSQENIAAKYQNLLGTNERDYLLNKDGAQIKISTLAGKIVGFYFSAHWCPPCRGFTPVLAELYQNLAKEGKPFEVVFLSSDKSKDAFDEYMSTMPWVAVPFGDQVKEKLSKHFQVRGIPTLILFDENGEVFEMSGRDAIARGKQYPFKN